MTLYIQMSKNPPIFEEKYTRMPPVAALCFYRFTFYSYLCVMSITTDIFDNISSPLPAGIGSPAIVAGPCSAESRTMVLDTARALAEGGVKVFRAGVWKPRTRPGGFEGIGLPALGWLAEVKAVTGMAVATEVATAAHAVAAAEAGIDILWVGARTSANPFAVQEIADALARMTVKPAVMVKNPVSPDLELWIGALQRLREAGIDRLGAIHRGFSTYGETVFRNRPCWSIPFELRRRIPSLTLLCDPSHIAGRRGLVESVAMKAMDMNFDGLMIECHPCPEDALSDAAQQLTPAALLELTATLPRRRGGTSEADMHLDSLRERIDAIDESLLAILARRMALTDEIGRYKRSAGLAAVQPARYNEMMRSRISAAAALGLDSEFMRRMLTAIHEESVRRQVDIID